MLACISSSRGKQSILKRQCFPCRLTFFASLDLTFYDAPFNGIHVLLNTEDFLGLEDTSRQFHFVRDISSRMTCAFFLIRASLSIDNAAPTREDDKQDAETRLFADELHPRVLKELASELGTSHLLPAGGGAIIFRGGGVGIFFGDVLGG